MRLLTGAEEKICLCDVQEGKNLLAIIVHSAAPLCMAGLVQTCNLQTLSSLDASVDFGSKSFRFLCYLSRIFFQPCVLTVPCECRNVATAGAEGTVRIWTVEEGEHLLTLEVDQAVPKRISGLNYSADGRFLIVGDWGFHLRVFDVKTGTAVMQFLHAHSYVAILQKPFFSTAKYLQGLLRIDSLLFSGA